MIFTVLSLAFAVTGYLFISKLKRYFPDFYAENKCTLLFAVIGLSFSLIIRGFIDNFRFFTRNNADIHAFVTTYVIQFNVTLFILSDLTPAVF
jgi:hypothetical protein